MTPLHTFAEYQCAKAVLSQLEERLLLVGLSDDDKKEMKELRERIRKYEINNVIKFRHE